MAKKKLTARPEWRVRSGDYLLGTGVGAMFVPGMIALAFWIIGGLYIAIAAVNLIVIFTSPRRAAT